MSHPLSSWIGKHATDTDVAAAAPLRRLAALLDHETPPWRPGKLPPLSHWLFHVGAVRQSELDADGHARRGGFLPPVTLPRRMWAGSRVRFHEEIAVGAQIVRQSTVADIADKSGASGGMTLVKVRHLILCNDVLAIEEEQDIIYLPERKGPAPQPRASVDPPPAEHVRRIQPTPELLFRFSALTFNSHRIHYDREYARQHEHYPALVVHGPLLATLLMDHYLRQRPAARVTGFSFRARAPAFEQEQLDLCSAGAAQASELWVAGADGSVRMTARVETTA